jgi:protease I
MADQPLAGKSVAVLVTDGFEQVELTSPVDALRTAGATVDVVSPKGGTVRGWDHTDWGLRVAVDRTLDEADAAAYDALILPGGQINPDFLRLEPKAIDFVRAFAQADKPIGAICHGPWTLINAEAVRGRKVTSFPSIRVDLENAGAEWRDAEVVVDRRLVTSRKPDDLEAFNAAVIDAVKAAAG